MLALSIVTPAVAQDSLRFRADAGAGLFGGDRTTYNGPIFHVRVGAPVRPTLWLALRGEYRDDDASGGRAESVGLRAEAVFVWSSGRRAIYVPVGLGLDRVHVTPLPTFPPSDATSGTYAAVDIGVGIEATGGRRRVIIEARRSFRTFGNSSSLSVGMRTYAIGTDSLTAGLDLTVSTLGHLNAGYSRDRAFRSYAVSYRQSLPYRFPTDVRALIGIDFLRFAAGGSSWSTGAITLAAGAGLSVFSTTGGNVRLSLVSHAGALYFPEPGGPSLFPLLTLGPEARLTTRAIGIVAAAHALLAGGPGGTLTGIRSRIGLTVGL